MSDRAADVPDRAVDRRPSGAQRVPPEGGYGWAADVPGRAGDRRPSGVQRGPPEGGYGWAVCLAAMWTNGTIFGLLNTSGVLFVALLEAFPGSDAFQTAWVGSTAIGVTFFCSTLASVLTDQFGCRPTAVAGGVVAFIGMLSSSAVSHLQQLYLTYGVLVGLGSSLAYTPSLVILGHYFHRRMGLVNGLVTFGSSLFTMVLPILLRFMLRELGLFPTFRALSGLVGTLVLCGCAYAPLLERRPRALENGTAGNNRRRTFVEKMKKHLNLRIWRNRRYVIWAVGVPFALFGYFVPYVHIVNYVRHVMPKANGAALVTYMGAASGVGRLVFGKVSDCACVNRIMLQQLSFLVIGIVTTLLPVLRHYYALVCAVLVLGVFDGCFVALIGPIAFDLVGPEDASQAIGFLLGLASVPLTVGPPLAGWIYDYTGSYNAAFFYAGAPPIVGTCILFLVSLGRFSAGEGGEKRNDAANVPDEEKALAADTKAPHADHAAGKKAPPADHAAGTKAPPTDHPARKSVGTQCTDLDREFALDAGSVMHIYNTEEDMILIYDKVSSV
ncbi:monocarboxylate transporter 10-like [Branchiostoma floridae x Branchiostoma japonicum]